MQQALYLETEQIPGMCPECGSGIDHVEERVLPGFEWAVIVTFYPCGHERVRRVHREIADRLRFRNEAARNTASGIGNDAAIARGSAKLATKDYAVERVGKSGHQIGDVANGNRRQVGTGTNSDRAETVRQTSPTKKRSPSQQAP